MNFNEEVKRLIEPLILDSNIDWQTKRVIQEWADYVYLLNGYKWAQLVTSVGEIIANGEAAYKRTLLFGSVGVEFMLLAADIIDDIVDQDNDLLPWRQVDESHAIHIALSLISLGYKALNAIEDVTVYRKANLTLQDMCLVACGGQLQELRNQNTSTITLEGYYNTIMKKSVSLTEAACKMGVILAGGHDELIDEIGYLGTRMGLMSQIKNDLRGCPRRRRNWSVIKKLQITADY